MSRERIINQTKQLLKDNLIDLLEKKNLEKITIKELCEKADINFQNKCLSFIGKKIFNKKEYSTIDEEIVYIYTAVGSFGIVSEWIKGNLKINTEELIKQILKLNNTKL